MAENNSKVTHSRAAVVVINNSTGFGDVSAEEMNRLAEALYLPILKEHSMKKQRKR